MVFLRDMPPTETPAPPPRPRKRKRRFVWRLFVLAIVLWLVHPLILSGLLRWGLNEGVGLIGWQITIGRLEASLNRRWILQDVHLWARDAKISKTDVYVDRLRIVFNAPWKKFGDTRRFIDDATVEGIRGTFDLRPEAMPPPYMPDLDPEEQVQMAKTIMEFLPVEAHIRAADLEFLAPGQSYRLTGGQADFEEGKTKEISIREGFVRAGTLSIDTGPLRGPTTWENGTATLTNIVFRDDMKVDRFRARFANVGGVALDLDSRIFGGTLTGEIIFISQNDLPAMDTYLELKNFDLGALSALLTLEPPVYGTVESGRYTFKGIPEKVWDAESSLELRLLNPRWQKNTCDVVELKARHKLKQVTLSHLLVSSGSNQLTAEAETTLDDKGEFHPESSPLVLHSRGEFPDVALLSSLWGGEPLPVMGHATLTAEGSRKDGRIDGSVKLAGQELVMAGRSFQEAHLEIDCIENLAKITKAELSADEDFVRGQGQVSLLAPYAYEGDLKAHVGEIAAYLDAWAEEAAASIYAGTLDGHWSGRGDSSKHDGDFDFSLHDFFSDFTPAGLTGQLVGRYSPEAVEINTLSLHHQTLQFSTQAKLDRRGITINDAKLLAETTPLGSAQVFLPVNALAMAHGQSLKQAWDADREVQATITSTGALKVEDLLKLAGQEVPLTGTVSMNIKAGGKLTELAVNGDFQGRDLLFKMEGTEVPPASFDASLRAQSGLARLSGALATKSLPPLTFSAEMPFGFQWTAEDNLEWANPEGQVKGQISVPQTDVAVFQPFLPNLKRLKGTLSGGLSVSGTVAKPQMNGQLTLSNGALQMTTRTPLVGNLQGLIKFDAQRAILEKFSGELAAGPFNARGSLSFADPKNPRYDLHLSGQKLLLARDPGLRLRANVEMQAQGDNNSGSVRGEVALVDGRVYRRLEITPLLAPSPVNGPLFVPPDMTGLVPPPFANWTVDIHIKNATPFKLVGNIASGEIVPDLRLTGRLGNPIPVGRVEMRDARAFLPFSVLHIQEGHFDFVESSPWVPQLDVRGVAPAQDYIVRAYAYGPLNDHRLILRADPPLPQESIVLLLTTGFVPGIYAGEGFGEAAVGQGGLLLLRAILRQFEPEGVDVDSFMNRLQVTATPPQVQGERGGLRGKFDVWKGISAMSERDSFGYYNAGATYTFRFR